jgi:hypothetical protein
MKRRHHVRARAHAIGVSARRGLGSTLAGGGVGAVAFFAQNFAAQKWPSMVGSAKGYAPGAVLLLAGHFVGRSKYQRFSGALCGAAGYALAQNFQVQRMVAAQAAANPAALPGGTSAVAWGRDLTGAVARGRDLTGAVDDAYGTGDADAVDMLDAGDPLETGAVDYQGY